ncbi:MAG: hypothetical protein V1714_01860 [Pseudomonadota bacterium]
MLRRTVLFLLAMTLVIAGPVFGQKESEPNDSADSYAEFFDNMDLMKRTELHVKNYWEKMKGQEVIWSGEVVDAQTKRGGRAQILIADKTRPRSRGYNIVLISPDLDAAAGLEKGQVAKFKGVIHNYRGRRGNPLIVSLIDVYFIK